MSNGVLDTNALRRAAPGRLSECTEQAKAIIEAHGDDVKLLVVGANAMPGRAFTPLTGYAIELSPDAAFVPGHYDVQNLFRGRCVLPLIPNSLLTEESEEAMSSAKKSLTDDRLMVLYEEARREAVADNREDPDQMTLADSSGGAGRACLFLDEKTESYLLSIEAHMLPDKEALGEDISAYLARFAGDISVSDAFFPGHPVGMTMIRYMKAQKAFRESLCRRLRDKMIRHFLGREDSIFDEGKAIHFVTHIANREPNRGTFLFYSNMLEATMEGGALVGAGPFKRSLWVNWNGEGGEMIADVELLRAVPFNMPTAATITQTLQRVIVWRESEKEGSLDGEFAVLRLGNKEHTHLSHNVVKSLASGPESGPLGMARRRVPVVGDLVYPHFKHHTGGSVPILSPYEDISYVRSLESSGTLNAMKVFGVDLVKGSAWNSALTPLFCATDAPSVQAALAMAEASAMQHVM